MAESGSTGMQIHCPRSMVDMLDRGGRPSALRRMVRSGVSCCRSLDDCLRTLLVFLLISGLCVSGAQATAEPAKYDHRDFVSCFNELPTEHTRALWAESREASRDLSVTVTVGPVLTFHRDWVGDLVAQATVMEFSVATEAEALRLSERGAELEAIIAGALNGSDWRGRCSINQRTETEYRIWREIDNLADDIRVGWTGGRSVGRNVPKN